MHALRCSRPAKTPNPIALSSAQPLASSAADKRETSSSGDMSPKASLFLTVNFVMDSRPSVSVPVLSITTKVAFANCSKATPDFKVTPCFAATLVPDRNATGTPMLSGHGVAPTNTPSAASQAARA